MHELFSECYKSVYMRKVSQAVAILLWQQLHLQVLYKFFPMLGNLIFEGGLCVVSVGVCGKFQVLFADSICWNNFKLLDTKFLPNYNTHELIFRLHA